MTKRRKKTKWLAGLVAAIFVWTSVIFEPNLFAQTLSAQFQLNQSLSIHGIQIPDQYGHVNGSYKSSNAESTLLIHIQDAHGQLSAQENIQSILSHLMHAYDFQALFLEGAPEGPVSRDLLKFFAKDEMNIEMANDLAEEGGVTGAGLFMLTEKERLKVYGTEDVKLYQDHLASFREVYRDVSATDEFLTATMKSLDKLASRILDSELYKFVTQWAQFDESKQMVDVYFYALEQLAYKYLTLDLKDALHQAKYPQLVRFFKVKKTETKMRSPLFESKKKDEIDQLLNWVVDNGLSDYEDGLKQVLGKAAAQEKLDARAFLESFYQAAQPKGFDFEQYPSLQVLFSSFILAHELDAESLFQETDVLVQGIFDSLIKSDKGRQIIRLYRDMRLFKRLLKLEVTRSEMHRVKERARVLDPDTLTVRIEEIEGNEKPLARHKNAELQNAFQNALEFYDLAEQRDRSIAWSVIQHLQNRSVKKAVLITGGFHAEGIQRTLAQNNISFVSVMPKIHKLDSKDKYLDMILPKSKSANSAYLQFLSTDRVPLSAMRQIDSDSAAIQAVLLRQKLRLYRDVEWGPAWRLHGLPKPPAKKRSEVRMSLAEKKRKLVGIAQSHADYLSKGDSFEGARPDVFVVLANHNLRSHRSFVNQWQLMGSNIPIVITGGRGRATNFLIEKVIAYYQSAGTLTAKELAWLKKAKTNDAIYETDILEFVYHTKEGIPKKFIHREKGHSGHTRDTFLNSVEPVQKIIGKKRKPVIAIVTSPPKLLRSLATARKQWEDQIESGWQVKRLRTYHYQLHELDDAELIQDLGYYIGYPDSYASEYPKLNSWANHFSELEGTQAKFYAEVPGPPVVKTLRISEANWNLLAESRAAFKEFLDEQDLNYDPNGNKLIPVRSEIRSSEPVAAIVSADAQVRSEVREALPIPDDRIHSILTEHYGLGPEYEIETTPKPHVFIVTSGDRKVVLKRPRFRNKPELVRWEASVLEQLHDGGIRAGRVINNRELREWTMDNDELFVVYDYVEGDQWIWSDELDQTTIRTAGRLLGKIHNITSVHRSHPGRSYTQEELPTRMSLRAFNEGFEDMREMAANLQGKNKSELSEGDIFFLENYKKIERHMGKVERSLTVADRVMMPKVNVHGDFYQDNLALLGERDMGTFDLEYSHYDARAFDFALRTALEEDEQGRWWLSLEKISDFLMAYQQTATTKLRDVEIDNLEHIFRFYHLWTILHHRVDFSDQPWHLTILREQIDNLDRLDSLDWGKLKQDLREQRGRLIRYEAGTAKGAAHVLAKHYDIGPFKLTETDKPRVWIAEAEDKKYVFKKARFRTSEEKVAWEAAWLNTLHRHEIGVAQIVKNHRGEHSVTIGQDVYVVYEYMEGEQWEWHEDVDSRTLSDAGALLAQIHNVSKEDGELSGQPYQNDEFPPGMLITDVEPGLARLEQLAQDVGEVQGPLSRGDQYFKDHFPQLAPHIGRVRDVFSADAVATLPRAIVHGDFYQDNLTRMHDGSLGVFDFEFAIPNESRLFDLALRLVLEQENVETYWLSLEKIRDLTTGYQQNSELPFTDQEIELLPEVYRFYFLWTILIHRQHASDAPWHELILKEQINNLARMDSLDWKGLQDDLRAQRSKLEADYLATTPITDADHASITSLAASITESATSDLQKAELIFAWLEENMHYAYDHGWEAKASKILESTDCQCGNAANLAVALLRASGIPAQFGIEWFTKESYQFANLQTYAVIGTRADGRTKHAWAAARIDGRWYKLDPVLQGRVNVGLYATVPEAEVRMASSLDEWVAEHPSSLQDPAKRKELTGDFYRDRVPLWDGSYRELNKRPRRPTNETRALRAEIAQLFARTNVRGLHRLSRLTSGAAKIRESLNRWFAGPYSMFMKRVQRLQIKRPTELENQYQDKFVDHSLDVLTTALQFRHTKSPILWRFLRSLPVPDSWVRWIVQLYDLIEKLIRSWRNMPKVVRVERLYEKDISQLGRRADALIGRINSAIESIAPSEEEEDTDHAYELFYLAAALHDIGKAHSYRGHERLGSDLIRDRILLRDIVKRGQITEEDAELVRLAVKHHDILGYGGVGVVPDWTIAEVLEDEEVKNFIAEDGMNIDYGRVNRLLNLIFALTLADHGGHLKNRGLLKIKTTEHMREQIDNLLKLIEHAGGVMTTVIEYAVTDANRKVKIYKRMNRILRHHDDRLETRSDTYYFDLFEEQLADWEQTSGDFNIITSALIDTVFPHIIIKLAPVLAYVAWTSESELEELAVGDKGPLAIYSRVRDNTIVDPLAFKLWGVMLEAYDLAEIRGNVRIYPVEDLDNRSPAFWKGPRFFKAIQGLRENLSRAVDIRREGDTFHLIDEDDQKIVIDDAPFTIEITEGGDLHVVFAEKRARSEVREPYTRAEVLRRIEGVSDIWQRQQRPGGIQNKIEDIVSDDYFREGGVAYIPSVDNGELIVIGDIHGDVASMQAAIKQYDVKRKLASGDPVHVVFMGDYIGDGSKQLESVMEVLGLKMEYPEKVTLLRGNHDQKEAPEKLEWIAKWNTMWPAEQGFKGRSFKESVEEYYDEEIYEAFTSLFNDIPIVAVTGNRILLGHGAPPNEEITGLRDLVDNDAAHLQIRNNLTVVPEYKRDDVPIPPKMKLITQEAFDQFLALTGADVFVGGHDHEQMADKFKMNGKLITVITGGGESPDAGPYISTMPSRFAVFSLSDRVREFSQDHIHYVERDALQSILAERADYDETELQLRRIRGRLEAIAERGGFPADRIDEAVQRVRTGGITLENRGASVVLDDGTEVGRVDLGIIKAYNILHQAAYAVVVTPEGQVIDELIGGPVGVRTYMLEYYFETGRRRQVAESIISQFELGRHYDLEGETKRVGEAKEFDSPPAAELRQKRSYYVYFATPEDMERLGGKATVAPEAVASVLGAGAPVELISDALKRSEVRDAPYTRDEVLRRINGVSDIWQGLQRPGKIQNKIQDIVSDEYFQEGGVVYIPGMENGELIVIGDIHGDLASMQAAIKQYDVVNKLRSGDPIHVAFMGDYIADGSKQLEAMMEVLGLKMEYPDKVTLIRGNHDQKEDQGRLDWVEQWNSMWPAEQGFKARSFKESVEEYYDEEIHEAFVRFFDEIPIVAVTENGILLGHGAPPNEEISGLRDLIDNPTAHLQIRNNLTVVPEYERDGVPIPGKMKLITQEEFDRFLDLTGADVFVEGHDHEQMADKFKMNGKMITVITGGGESPDSGPYISTMPSRFAVLPLDKRVTEFSQDHIHFVKRDVLQSILTERPDYDEVEIRLSRIRGQLEAIAERGGFPEASVNEAVDRVRSGGIVLENRGASVVLDDGTEVGRLDLAIIKAYNILHQATYGVVVTPDGRVINELIGGPVEVRTYMLEKYFEAGRRRQIAESIIDQFNLGRHYDLGGETKLVGQAKQFDSPPSAELRQKRSYYVYFATPDDMERLGGQTTVAPEETASVLGEGAPVELVTAAVKRSEIRLTLTESVKMSSAKDHAPTPLELTVANKASDDVLSAQQARFVGDEGMRQVLHAMDPSRYPLVQFDKVNFSSLMTSPSRFASSQLGVVQVYEAMPDVNEAGISAFVDLLARNPFLTGQIYVPGAERSAVQDLRNAITRNVLKKRRQLGITSKGANIQVTSSQSKVLQFAAGLPGRLLVLDPSRVVLNEIKKQAASGLRQSSQTLLIYDDAVGVDRAETLTAGVNTLTEREILPNNILVASELMNLQENLHISAQAQALLSQAA